MKQREGYGIPPGGVPVLGVDFWAGPEQDGGRLPGMCVCGCGLKASLGPHDGLLAKAGERTEAKR